MKTMTRVVMAFTAMLMAVSVVAQPHRVILPQGTDVVLAFDQSLSSKTAKPGETVRFHVVNPVVENGRTVIAAGTPVTGVITQVKHRQRFGVNAKIQLTLNPVRSTTGTMIPIEPATKGHYVGGSQSTKAGAASGGGALVLGPVGLVGGAFVQGKRVEIHRGDRLVTQVSTNTVLR